MPAGIGGWNTIVQWQWSDIVDSCSCLGILEGIVFNQGCCSINKEFTRIRKGYDSDSEKTLNKDLTATLNCAIRINLVIYRKLRTCQIYGYST